MKNVISRLELKELQTDDIREEYETKIKLLEDTICEKEKLIKNYTPLTPKSFDSSLLIYDSNNNNLKRNSTKFSNKNKETDLNNSLNASLLLKDNKIDLNELKQTLNSQLIVEEHRKIKEKLQNTILQKANALEISKIQRKENFDNLKSKLHDIEIMTSLPGTS